MSRDIRALIKEQRALCEVRPCYVVLQCRLEDGSRGSPTVQAGFDVDVYGVVGPGEWQPPEDYWMAYSDAREVIERVTANFSSAYSIEVIPFGSKVFIHPRNQSQLYRILRVKITNRAGIDKLAELSMNGAVTDLPEKHALKELAAAGRRSIRQQGIR